MERTWNLAAVVIALVIANTGAAPAQEQARTVVVTEGVALAVPVGWQVTNRSRDSIELALPGGIQPRGTGGGANRNPKPEIVVPPTAGMLVTIEHRRDHQDALKRLAEISVEYPERPKTLLIGGWPAIERIYRSYEPQPGEGEGAAGNRQTTFTTTAIAIGATLVRFNTMYARDNDEKSMAQAFAAARNLRMPPGPAELSQKELNLLPSLAPQRHGSAPGPRGATRIEPRGRRPLPGVPVQVQNGVGELEVATNDGQHVVVAANSGFSFSDNAAGVFTLGGGTPCNQALCDGDPSLAVGNSGAIYYSWIGGPAFTQLGDGLSRSTDNGHTFPFRAMMVNCPGSSSCQVADQEHIAADRFNAAGGGGDRVYNVWRNFTSSVFSIRIACSSDGGSTWPTSAVVGTGDFPRVAVGRDGSVYVAWASGGNMMINKYSACDSGLAPQGGVFPYTVAAFANVVCPVAGLDRCNGRNILASPVIAGDDLDGQHIYYAFTTSSGAGNENVMIMDSNDSGATFPRSVQANTATTARRYLSWVSTYGGMAVVSWYDRRHATGAQNDLARYFIGGAAVRGPNLVALNETDLSGVDDQQCTVWPWPTNASTDSESCTTQPQLAGFCAPSGTTNPPTGYTHCDFSSTVCPSGQVCLNANGAPKYGDYNGNAAGGGRMFSAWASTVPPSGVGGTSGTLRVYSSGDRIPSDFYVRDWNAAPDFDNGQQPSTHGDFWSTSDVWNQNTTTAAAPGPGGWVVGDAPTLSGSNFLFAKISRRAAAASIAPSATVTANFFVADFGMGALYNPVGSEMVTFAAADMSQVTPAHSWSVPAAPGHLCAAVQIAGPDGDVSGVAPLGGTPAGTGVVADNNVAQRNLQDVVGTGAGTELIALVRNWLPEGRAMRLRVTLSENIRLAGTFDVIATDQREPRRVPIEPKGVIDLGTMRAGEVRWVRFHLDSLKGVDKPVAVHVAEDAARPGNGFTLLVHRDTTDRVVRVNLMAFANVLTRLAKLEESAQAMKLAEVALQRARTGRADSYLPFLAQSRKMLDDVVAAHLQKMGSDPFEVRAAIGQLWSAIEQKDVERAAAAHTALNERIDAQLTAWVYAKRPPR